MNELENKSMEENVVEENKIAEVSETSKDAQETNETPEIVKEPVEEAPVAEEIVEKKTETTAPEACEIESSPALDLAEAADRIEENEKKTEESQVQSFHSMTRAELVASLQDILDNDRMNSHKEVAAIRQAYNARYNKDKDEEIKKFVEAGNDASAYSATPDPEDLKLKELLAEFKERRNAYLEKKEAERITNLENKKAVIEELKHISEDIDNINLQFSKFQELQTKFKSIGEVPPGSENDIWKSYQQAVEQFYDRLKMNKELRDLDFKKNLEVKRVLIEKAKELVGLPDVVEAFRELQSLHVHWRETGPVARELREDIWNEFKDLSSQINKRHQEFFQSRKENEAINEKAKEELCAKAEAIDYAQFKTFSEWDNATKEIIDLQQQWKGLGFASKKVNNQLFARFRKSCDEFFSAKAEYFKKTKEEFRNNLEKKEALCEKAEALVDRYAEKEAFDEVKKLQEEWRTIGFVRRKQGDEVWKRFCTAIDAFYDARKKMFGGKREEENENLKLKKEIIEKLKAIPEDADRKDVIDEIKSLRDEWQKVGHVPFKLKDSVFADYRAELDRLYKSFDIQENTRRMRNFENEVKKFEGDGSKISREKDKLLNALDKKRSELKTLENNMLFFNVKSSAGNSMMKEIERKAQKIKEDISQIEQKIAILDNPAKEAEE